MEFKGNAKIIMASGSKDLLPDDGKRYFAPDEKVQYVKRQKQTRKHTCHWPGCEKQVPPAMWGCKQHWLKLPAELRQRIWDTYQPGQEKTLTPSAEYIEVARAVQDWIAAHLAK